MLDIIYQDEAIVVCVKPFRVISTDEPGGMPDLIREALGKPRLKARAVHRLDQVVGGLMVYGLTGPAASELSRQIREDSFLKEYQAVVHWRPQYDEGTFTDLLGRDEKKDPEDLRHQDPRQGGPGGHPPLPASGQPAGLLPGGDPPGDRPDPPDPGPVLPPGDAPGRGPEIQQISRPQGLADRPVVQPSVLHPSRDRPGHGLPPAAPGNRALDVFCRSVFGTERIARVKSISRRILPPETVKRRCP